MKGMPVMISLPSDFFEPMAQFFLGQELRRINHGVSHRTSRFIIHAPEHFANAPPSCVPLVPVRLKVPFSSLTQLPRCTTIEQNHSTILRRGCSCRRKANR